ncbi:BnaA01g27480D [Brassica napus]|uniref:(rape) hypothetical protein n=1 Tax=Brassica napus TaxID=3708 RepID=A0A078HB84_BRANA|nr:unnamed protein product [Brassica napus]CDY34986.1 BnaA01g27480D [Brassica napus]
MWLDFNGPLATMISDLPRDMAEEVLSKFPITSLRGVRFTCKKWNTIISNDPSFTKKVVAKQKDRKEFQGVMFSTTMFTW